MAYTNKEVAYFIDIKREYRDGARQAFDEIISGSFRSIPIKFRDTVIRNREAFALDPFRRARFMGDLYNQIVEPEDYTRGAREVITALIIDSERSDCL